MFLTERGRRSRFTHPLVRILFRPSANVSPRPFWLWEAFLGAFFFVYCTAFFEGWPFISVSPLCVYAVFIFAFSAAIPAFFSAIISASKSTYFLLKIIITCRSARYWLYMIFLLYFGTNTMWYLQTHLVWDKLFVRFAILSPFVLQ